MVSDDGGYPVIDFVKQLTNDQARRLKTYKKQVERINEYEETMQALDDEALRQYALELKQRLTDGADVRAITEEAFALVREASVRTIGLRHYDVQLIGGLALLEGNIAEMPTGEGLSLIHISEPTRRS